MSLLEQELGQARPFDDPMRETILAVMKSGDVVQRELEATVAAQGLTLQQYHVLRILRAAGGPGLPVLDIAEQLIEDNPNVTRLLDRLVAKGLAERRRSAADKRVVHAVLTPAGDAVLSAVQAPMQQTQRTICGTLSSTEIESLNRILEKLRLGVYRRRQG